MKKLTKADGNLTVEGKVVVRDTVDFYTPLFEDYIEKGYNVFEVLGVITSSIINAQKQAWINKVLKKK